MGELRHYRARCLRGFNTHYPLDQAHTRRIVESIIAAHSHCKIGLEADSEFTELMLAESIPFLTPLDHLPPDLIVGCGPICGKAQYCFTQGFMKVSLV